MTAWGSGSVPDPDARSGSARASFCCAEKDQRPSDAGQKVDRARDCQRGSRPLARLFAATLLIVSFADPYLL